MSPTAFFSFKFETISSIYTPNVYLEKRFRCACALVRDIYNISSLLLLFLFYFVLRLPNTRIAYAGVFPPKHTCPFIPCSRNGMQFFALGDTIIVLLIPERLDKEGSFFRSTIVYKSNIFLGEIFSERNYGKYIFYKEKETEEILLPRIIQLFQLFHRQKSRLFAASINSRTRTVLNTYSRGNMCVWESGGKSMETPRPRCLCKIARAGGKTNITGFLLKQGCSYKKKKKERKREKKEKEKEEKGREKRQHPLCTAPSFPFSLVSTPSGLCTRLFPSIFLAIEEAACLRHRQMFIGRNTDVFSVLAAIFHPPPSSTTPLSLTLISPIPHPSTVIILRGRVIPRDPSFSSCQVPRSSFLINALWNRGELTVSLRAHVYCVCVCVRTCQCNCLPSNLPD